MNDELRQRGVERLLVERQLLGRGTLHVDAWVALSSCCDEGLRRIDGGHGGRSQPRDQLDRERTRSTADIEHSLTGSNGREIRDWGASSTEYLPMKRS